MTATDDRTPYDAGPVRPPARRDVPVALGVFVVVLLSLQVFLLTVAVDAFLVDDERLAWITAALSVLVAAGTAGFYRYLR
ncbi:MAG TPA: hypothetical protein VF743_07020 [Acidimicrobiales bacterium]